MTADYKQNRHASKFIGLFGPEYNRAGKEPGQALSGFELTRLQNFLEGRQDIFDVLESHTANTSHEETDIPAFLKERPASAARKKNSILEVLSDFLKKGKLLH